MRSLHRYVIVLSIAVGFVVALTYWKEHHSVSSPRLLLYHDVAGTGLTQRVYSLLRLGHPGYTVTYDERSFFIDKKRVIILSGSVHYPRLTPGMWDHILEEMKKDGLNVVEVYVFWNIHEFKRGQKYDFTGSANLPLFIEKAAKAGLFVNLRIGPYVCAEWNYGGLPVWLNSISGINLRSDSPAWKKEMERFVTDIAKIMEKYLAQNGGPIIMSQIENEYWSEHMGYVNWCGELAAKLDLGIPWVMCNGLSANGTINSYNGNDGSDWYVKYHLEKYPGQPLTWMENEGWFQKWAPTHESWFITDRTPEDMAYVVLAWFARGGCHNNYYMWYGGNHMGRSAAAGVTNKYADGVNLHSDMLPNEPKRTHLTRLHKLIHRISAILLSSKVQANNPVYLLHYNATTKKLENSIQHMAFVYDNKAGKITFVQNSAPVEALVTYNNKNFKMKPLSIIVLDKTDSILYDSSKVDTAGLRTQRVYKLDKVKMNPFVAWKENVEITEGASTTEQHPLEQLAVTQDETDYLFYQTKVDTPLTDQPNYELKVESRKANGLLAFVNEQFAGAVDNHEADAGNMTYTLQIQSNGKPFYLTILSVSLGLYNVFHSGFLERKGIVGKVSINGHDITNQKWLHRSKLTGEISQVYTDDGSKQVNWDSEYIKYANTSLTWFKTTFTVEQYSMDYSLLLHLVGFGRGHFYVNGIDLGRYWLIMVDGQTVQEYYFIPPDVVKYDVPNLLVIGEELGAPDPSKATVVLSTMTV